MSRFRYIDDDGREVELENVQKLSACVEDGTVTDSTLLYDAETNGKILHTDSFDNLAIDNGHFVAYLGSDKDTPLDLQLFAERTGVWLEVVIDNETIAPRTSLSMARMLRSRVETTTVGWTEGTSWVMRAENA